MKKCSVRVLAGNRCEERHTYLEAWTEGYDLGVLTLHRPYISDQQYRELYVKTSNGDFVREERYQSLFGSPVPDREVRYRIDSVKPGCWNITHKASGLALGSFLLSKDLAKRYAEWLIGEFPFLICSEKEVQSHGDYERLKKEVNNNPHRTCDIRYKYVEA